MSANIGRGTTILGAYRQAFWLGREAMLEIRKIITSREAIFSELGAEAPRP
jgi:hypothetical protein